MAIRDLVLTPCVVCLTLAVGALADESPKPAQGDSSGQLARLLKERRDVLQEMVEAVTMQYKTGQATCEAVVRATDRLLDAELELAATQVERIAVLEKKVGNLLAGEKYLEQRHKAGRTMRSELLEAKAARLQAEIQLLRARSKVSSIPRGGIGQPPTPPTRGEPR